jgi:hypothetical protein
MSKPKTTANNHILPFGRLGAEDFERLTLWLVRAEGYVDIEHYGAGGNEQGRDIRAYKVILDERNLWYFQCKRYNRVGATTLTKELTKISELAKNDPSSTPKGIIFVVECNVSAKEREKVKKYCQILFGFECGFWASTELDLHVKNHPYVVKEFFEAHNIPPQQ